MSKKIIVAPLNWGLGHASRCVPVINALLENNYTPVIASDGNSLTFLQKEFPSLQSLELPSYNISYSKNVKLKLLLQVPKIWKILNKEQQLIEQFISKNKDVVGVISDNRFGVRSTKVPSIYITHQLNVLSGFTTFITSKIHQKFIKKFDECWVPDTKNSEFSGMLSSTKKNLKQKHIGILSRFKKENLPKNIDVLIILSGPEPNRTSLEKKLKNEFLNYEGNVVLVQGKVENAQKKFVEKNITVYNFMLSNKLQNAINSARMIICRSGYSSIMDLAVLEKKAFFIPNKNQNEQEYLAHYLLENKIAWFSSEEKFNLKLLEKLEICKGLSSEETKISTDLFCLFERK